MNKIKITYYFDALCGWCYGFTDVMHQLTKKYDSQITFDVVSGGLFIGERVGLVNDVAPYIKAGAYKTVENRTGVKFGDKFIESAIGQNAMLLESIYPAMALIIVKEIKPDMKMQFAHDLLHAYYSNGLSSDNIEGLSSYALKYGISKEDFISKMNNDEYKQKAKIEFQHSSSMNVGGFPSLVIAVDNQEALLSNGFTDFEVLDSKIKQVLASI